MKIGFSIVDITPELGIYLTGYGHPERLAEAIHSPLQASIMVMADEQTSAAIIGLDWCFVDWPLTQIIRRHIHQATAIPEQNILLCCSHTHSAPHTTYMRTLGRTAVDPENKGVEYAIHSASAIAEGVKTAQANLTECTAGFAATKTQTGVSRRGMDENGRVRGFIADPYQICDDNLTVIHFRDAKDGQDLGILVHLGAHNTAMGANRMISSDWCGVMKSRLRDRYQVPVVFVNGALGDVGPRTNRFVQGDRLFGYGAGGGDGIPSVEEVGYRAASDALRALETIREYRQDLPLAVSTAELHLPQALSMSKEEASAVIKKYEEQQQVATDQAPDYQVAQAVLQAYALPPEQERVVEQTIIAFGPVAFIPFPFEMFSLFSLRLRKYGPYPYNLLCSNTNGRNAYLPDRGAFAQGGYEPECLKTIRTYVITPDAGDCAITQSLQTLRKLFGCVSKP